jgi:hypothetical protein
VKNRTAATTHKKVVVVAVEGMPIEGYLNPATLGQGQVVDMLTSAGEHRALDLREIKSVYFVKEFQEGFELERKTFLSRPKLDGLWVRLRFRDEDVIEGIVSNNLLDLLDTGVQLTPPDLHGNVQHMFIPRSALAEMKVLGVVGGARRALRTTRKTRAVVDAQSKLFSE